MTAPDPGEYLADIITAAEKIERFTDGMTYESFVADEKTVDAVLRNFEVIGEAAKKVPTNVRNEYDEIPWEEMAGMRDKLIHGYATVDLEIVWTTVSEDVPLIVSQLKRIRDDLE